MASNGPPECDVKVGENRDYVDDYSSSNSDGDAGERAKRRRVTNDYRKLSKLGYDPSVSTNLKHGTSSDSKGTLYFFISTLVLHFLFCLRHQHHQSRVR